MEDYIAGYTAYLEKERHSSSNTVASYVRDVTQFARYLQEDEHVELPDCQDEHVERYMTYMAGRGKSPASVARCIASLKSFYSFLLSRGVHRVVADRLFALRGICPASRARWAQMLCEKPFFSRSVRFIFMWMGI